MGNFVFVHGEMDSFAIYVHGRTLFLCSTAVFQLVTGRKGWCVRAEEDKPEDYDKWVQVIKGMIAR